MLKHWSQFVPNKIVNRHPRTCSSTSSSVHTREMVLAVATRRLRSSSVGAFTWSSLGLFQSVIVWTIKRERERERERERDERERERERRAEEFSVACLSILFFAVKS